MSPQDEYRKRLNDRYEASRTDFKGSRFFARWKALSPPARKYIVGGILIVLVLLIAAGIWAEPGVYPSGEGS